MYRAPSRYTDDEDDDSAVENIQPLHAKRAPLRPKQLQNHFMLPAPPPEPMLPPQQPIDHSAATEVTMMNAEHSFDCSPQTLDQGPLPTSAESVATDSSAANLTQSAPASTVGAIPPILMASLLQGAPASTVAATPPILTGSLLQGAPASTVAATPPILMACQSTPPSAVQTPQGSSRSVSGKGNWPVADNSFIITATKDCVLTCVCLLHINYNCIPLTFSIADLCCSAVKIDQKLVNDFWTLWHSLLQIAVGVPNEHATNYLLTKSDFN